MSFDVYDYRKDIRNLLVTPQIRARFQRIEVGELSGGQRPKRGHSHDLGHEVFLVLQGKAEFDIDGETQVLGPGQMCIALIDQIHTVRNIGDEPVILYLSVTPHIQPTHTGWIDEGVKAPPHFNPSTAYDVPPDKDTPIERLVEMQLQAAEVLSAAVKLANEVQREQLTAFKKSLSEENKEAVLEARDAIWDVLYPMFQMMYELAEAWNALTYRTAEPEF